MRLSRLAQRGMATGVPDSLPPSSHQREAGAQAKVSRLSGSPRAQAWPQQDRPRAAAALCVSGEINNKSKYMHATYGSF